MKTNIKLLAFGAVAALVCATSCAKQDQLVDAPSDKVSLINFIPEWNEGSVSKAETPAETPVEAGLKITLGIAKRAEAETPKELTELSDFTVVNKKYTSATLGMTPQDGKTLSLGETATYDFYALAENKTEDGLDITFAKPATSPLENAFYDIPYIESNKDFLGAAVAKPVTAGTNIDMALPLKHLMSRIKIVIVADPSVGALLLENFYVYLNGIAASSGTSQVRFKDGAVSIVHPAVLRAGAESPTLSSLPNDPSAFVRYIFPVGPEPISSIDLNLMIVGRIVPIGAKPGTVLSLLSRDKLKINVGPDGIHPEAGKEYVYKVKISENEISFMNGGLPEVNDWTTGEPVVLIPSGVL